VPKKLKFFGKTSKKLAKTEVLTGLAKIEEKLKFVGKT